MYWVGSSQLDDHGMKDMLQPPFLLYRASKNYLKTSFLPTKIVWTLLKLWSAIWSKLINILFHSDKYTRILIFLEFEGIIYEELMVVDRIVDHTDHYLSQLHMKRKDVMFANSDNALSPSKIKLMLTVLSTSQQEKAVNQV